MVVYSESQLDHDLKESWEPLRPHWAQSAIWRTPARFISACAGRGSGKTEVLRRKCVRYLPVKKPWSDPMYFYALPTYQWAKRVAWGPIKKLVPKHWIKNISESEMCIETVFGSKLYVVGMDKPSRIEGNQWDGCVLDEASDTKPNAFSLSVLPALTHKNGWCARIGVPKRVGIGAAEYKEFFERGLRRESLPGTDDVIESYAWPSRDILTEKQLATMRALLSPEDFAEQFEASWEQAGGLIFHSFDKHYNVQPCHYVSSLPIVVGSDFNVNPMCWTLGHVWNGKLYVFAEIMKRNTHTQACLDYLFNCFPQHNAGWWFFGDASAKGRHTNAVFTDLALIKNDTRFVDKRIYYEDKNPPIVDRFAECNARLRNANGHISVFVDPRCKRLIADLTNRNYKEESREPADFGDMGHMSDGFGYIIHKLWPITMNWQDVGARAGFFNLAV